MADAFTIRVEGLRPVERRLGRLLARFGDLFPLMDRIGELLENTTRLRFETGRSPEGAPWKPSIRAEKEGGKTLVKDGHLRDSITHRASADRVEIGTNLIYAAIHQLGGTIRPVRADALVFELPGGLGLVHAKQVVIPARPYLGVSTSDEAAIVRLVDRYEEAAA